MCLSMVAACEHLARIRRDLEIKFIKDALVFIHLAQLLFKVVCDV